MKYISRLTALLLAFVLSFPSFAFAQMTLNELTQDGLDALYEAADTSADRVQMPAGVLGDTVSLSAFENAFFKNFHWYDAQGNEIASGSNTLEVSYKLVDQEFYCVNYGLISGFWDQTSDTFVIPAAQTDDLGAYLDFLFSAEFLDASGVPDHGKVFEFVTNNWDVILPNGDNLAQSVISVWVNETSHSLRDQHLFCTCVLNFVTSDKCMLHPDDSHLPVCPWFIGADTIVPPAEEYITPYEGDVDEHQYTQTISYDLSFSDNEAVNLPEDGRTILMYTGARSANRQWQVFTGEDWANIDGETAPQITLTNAMLDSIFELTGVVYLRYLDKSSNVVLTSVTVAETQPQLAAQPLALTAQTRNDSQPELSMGSVVVQYMYVDEQSKLHNTPVRTPNTWTVPGGTGLHTSVVIPNVKGYEAYIPESGFTISPAGAPIAVTTVKDGDRITGLKIDTDNVTNTITITVPYKRGDMTFTVQRLLELVEHAENRDNPDLNYEVYDDQNPDNDVFTGMTETAVGGTYNEETNTYERDAVIGPDIPGFRRAVYDASQPIAADGSTVVKVYYDRMYYLVSIDENGGYGAKPVYAKFGTKVKIDKPTRAGYTFLGWQPVNADGTPYMVNGQQAGLVASLENYEVKDQNVYFRAEWTESITHYTVVYWREAESAVGSTEPIKYEYWGSEIVGATMDEDGNLVLDPNTAVASGSTVQLSQYTTIPTSIATNSDGLNESYYFHYNEAQTTQNGTVTSVTVEGDGSTTVNIYFDRNEYTLKFYYAVEAENDYYVIGRTNRFGSEAPSSANRNDEISLLNTAWNQNQYYFIKATVDKLPEVDESRYTTGIDTGANNKIYYYFTFKAKYGADISEYWPTSEDISTVGTTNTRLGDAVFSAWNGEYNVYYTRHRNLFGNNETIKGQYRRLDYRVLWDTSLAATSDPDIYQNTVTYLAYWNNVTDQDWNIPALYRYNIYLECLNQHSVDTKCDLCEGKNPKSFTTDQGVTKTYYRVTVYDVADNSETTNLQEQTHPDVYGFTNVNGDGLTQGTEYVTLTSGDYDSNIYRYGYDIYWFYDRNRYNLEFWNEGKLLKLRGADGSFMDHQTIRYGVSLHNDGYDISEMTDENGKSYYPDTLPAGGYSFDAWYTSPNFAASTKFDFTGNPTMPAADLALYAHWVPNTYRVMFFKDEDDIEHFNKGLEQYGPSYDPLKDAVTTIVNWGGNTITLSMPMEYNPMTGEKSEGTTFGIPMQTPSYGERAQKVAVPKGSNGAVPVGWFYRDANGNQIAFDFSMPITEDLKLYPVYEQNLLLNYVLAYVLAETNEKGEVVYGEDGNPKPKLTDKGEFVTVAPDTVERGFAGYPYTHDAKYGDQLAQTNVFPWINSHTIVLDAEEEGSSNSWYDYVLPGATEATELQVFVFLYVPIQPVDYTVRYLVPEGQQPADWTKPDGETGDGTVMINGVKHYKLTADKTVSTQNTYIITENYRYFTGYMPNAYQKTLILSAQEENNVIDFIYTKDEDHAMVRVVHYIQDPNTGEDKLYMAHDVLDANRGEVFTEEMLTKSESGLTSNGQPIYYDFSSATVARPQLDSNGQPMEDKDGNVLMGNPVPLSENTPVKGKQTAANDTVTEVDTFEINTTDKTVNYPIGEDDSMLLLELYYTPTEFPYEIHYVERGENDAADKELRAPIKGVAPFGKVITADTEKGIDGYNLDSIYVDDYTQTQATMTIGKTPVADVDKNIMTIYYKPVEVTFNYIAVQEPLPGCGFVGLNRTPDNMDEQTYVWTGIAEDATKASESEIRKVINDTDPYGSDVKTKNEHFEFYGWYADAACMQKFEEEVPGDPTTWDKNKLYVDIDVDTKALTPMKTVPYQVYDAALDANDGDGDGMKTVYGYPVPADGTGVWNIYARFTYNTYVLRIVKDGLKPDETTIFSVTAVSALHAYDTEEKEPVEQEYWFALAGASSSSSSSIAHLIAGTSFSIKEHLEWAWAYEPLQTVQVTYYEKGVEKTEPLPLKNDTFTWTLPSTVPDTPEHQIVTVRITNQKTGDRWMHDEGLIANHMQPNTEPREEEVQ